MKETFRLIELNNESYDFLVIATSAVNPLNCLNDIVEEIGSDTAKVLFDLTLINGTNSNRYIQGNCVDGNFNIAAFMVVSSINEDIKNICKAFFVRNNELDKRSIISQKLKYLLMQGMV